MKIGDIIIIKDLQEVEKYSYILAIIKDIKEHTIIVHLCKNAKRYIKDDLGKSYPFDLDCYIIDEEEIFDDFTFKKNDNGQYVCNNFYGNMLIIENPSNKLFERLDFYSNINQKRMQLFNKDEDAYDILVFIMEHLQTPSNKASNEDIYKIFNRFIEEVNNCMVIDPVTEEIIKFDLVYGVNGGNFKNDYCKKLVYDYFGI